MDAAQAAWSRTGAKPGCVLRSVLYECDSGVAERFHGVILRQVTEPSNRLLGEVVRRESTGMTSPDAPVDDLVLDVVLGPTMYRSQVCGSEWQDEEIVEMTDQVMAPFLRPVAGRRQGTGPGCRRPPPAA